MKCKRCGKCCETMALCISPKELKKYYDNWRNEVKDTPRAQDIFLIYPMLQFLQYDKMVQRYRYKCKHFQRVKGKGACTIYPDRPSTLCAEYGVIEKFKMGITGSANNRLYPGCVF